MTKYQQIAEKIVITFVEAAIAYWVVIPHTTITKTAIAGAVGAGLSAVYNLLRESNPTILVTANSAPINQDKVWVPSTGLVSPQGPQGPVGPVTEDNPATTDKTA